MKEQLVLFLCPHGAAKSVMAAALCQRMAAVQNLPLRVLCAGTEPDPELAPHVRALLGHEGLALPVEQPQVVTTATLAEADYVISMGCDRDALPGVPQRWESWADVPPPSQDVHGAYSCIQQHLGVWLESIQRRLPHG